MLRTLALALTCLLVTAPLAHGKKRHGHARPAKHATHKSKAKGAAKAPRQTALARVQEAPPPPRVAAVEQRPTPPPTRVAAIEQRPTPPPAEVTAPPPSPPVEHGPMGPQATDDEVPGSRAKR